MSNCGNPANQSVGQQQVEFHQVGLLTELHVHPTLWSWLVEQPLGKAFMCLLELSKASTATDFGGGGLAVFLSCLGEFAMYSTASASLMISFPLLHLEGEQQNDCGEMCCN